MLKYSFFELLDSHIITKHCCIINIISVLHRGLSDCSFPSKIFLNVERAKVCLLSIIFIHVFICKPLSGMAFRSPEVKNVKQHISFFVSISQFQLLLQYQRTFKCVLTSVCSSMTAFFFTSTDSLDLASVAKEFINNDE